MTLKVAHLFYVPYEYQSLTRPDRAIGGKEFKYETTSDFTFGIGACRLRDK